MARLFALFVVLLSLYLAYRYTPKEVRTAAYKAVSPHFFPIIVILVILVSLVAVMNGGLFLNVL